MTIRVLGTSICEGFCRIVFFSSLVSLTIWILLHAWPCLLLLLSFFVASYHTILTSCFSHAHLLNFSSSSLYFLSYSFYILLVIPSSFILYDIFCFLAFSFTNFIFKSLLIYFFLSSLALFILYSWISNGLTRSSFKLLILPKTSLYVSPLWKMES